MTMKQAVDMPQLVDCFFDETLHQLGSVGSQTVPFILQSIVRHHGHIAVQFSFTENVCENWNEKVRTGHGESRLGVVAFEPMIERGVGMMGFKDVEYWGSIVLTATLIKKLAEINRDSREFDVCLICFAQWLNQRLYKIVLRVTQCEQLDRAH